MNTYTTWIAYIAKLKEKGISFENSEPVTGNKHNGLKLTHQALPISISELEFNIMRSIITRYDLKSIYELSTGLGVSTMSLALAAKDIGGKVLTYDSYAEDANQDQPIGVVDQKIFDYTNSACYKAAIAAAQAFDVESFVDFRCGWSPQDTVPALKKFTDDYGRLQFVFFDCPKCDDDFERDLTSVVPFLADKYVICIHDTHTYTAKANAIAKKLTGYDYHKILTTSQFYPLGMLTNLANIEDYRTL